LREVATTLTDYLLGAVCLLCAWRLANTSRSARLHGPVVFFAGFAAAALLGGTWHGFFSAGQAHVQELLWWLTMVLAGVASAGLALTGFELMSAGTPRWATPLLGMLFAVYGLIAWHDPRFLVGLIASVAGTSLCATGLARRLRGRDGPGARLALTGLGLSVLAAIAQQQGVALDRVRFDHNATYHLLLLPALGLFYAGCRRMARVRVTPGDAS
jgi:hypothetical protein